MSEWLTIWRPPPEGGRSVSVITGMRVLQPDEVVVRMGEVCPTLWDEEAPEIWAGRDDEDKHRYSNITIGQDQWWGVWLRCPHGEGHGVSDGWEHNCIAVAFSRAFREFRRAHGLAADY